MNPAARLAGAMLAGAAFAAGAAPEPPPLPGRHTAQLCVATSAAPPSCGPAQADLRADGSLRVRVDDVVYNLQLRAKAVEIVVMHNVVQIDEFVVPYEWVGRTLRFQDDERHSRYEIRFADQRR
ncbi:MAG TPA: hypothetical protein VNU71_11915 [Burkholderiaceae bacterium]|nr:hypothetical protein [Burkholderiaceae bacterium]